VEVVEVGVVQPVQRGDIGQQLGFVLFQRIADIVDLVSNGFILLDDFDQRLSCAEQFGEEAGLLVRVQLVEVETAQHRDHFVQR